MSTIIKRLKDKLGNFVLPITNTKAVYDDNGNRLDRILKCAPIQEYNKSGIYLSIAVKNVIDENIDSVLTNSSEFNFMLKCKHKDNPWDTTYNVICNVYYKTYCSGLIIKVDGSNERYSFNYTLGQELSNIISFVDNDTISDAYNPSKTYAQNEFCIYSNVLWKSRVNNNTGNTPLNETYWEATNVAKEIVDNKIVPQYIYQGLAFEGTPEITNDGLTFVAPYDCWVNLEIRIPVNGIVAVFIDNLRVCRLYARAMSTDESTRQAQAIFDTGIMYIPKGKVLKVRKDSDGKPAYIEWSPIFK